MISSHPVGTPPPFATPTFSTPALTLTATDDAPPAKTTGGSSMRGLASKSLFSLVRGGVEALTSTVAEQALQVLGAAPHPAEVNALPPLPTSILDAPSISLGNGYDFP